MKPRRVSLFWQIFGWFWGAMALMAAGLVGLEFLTPQQPLALGQRALIERSIVAEAAQAGKAWRQGGRNAVARELGRFQAETGVEAFLMEGQSGEDVLGHRLPAPLSRLVREVTPGSGIQWRVAGLRVQAAVSDGAGGVFAVRFERGAFAQRASTRLLRLLVVLCTAGLVCWLLAGRMTQPITVIRSATRQFAGGDFSARAILGPRGRQDELALLAGDFNTMAAKIEALIGAQQRLVGDVSHELRSPLTRLKIALALAQRDAPPEPPLLSHLERIEQEARSLDQLVGELLLLFRLENHLQPGQMPRLDWLGIVGQVVADLRWEAENRPEAVDIEFLTELNSASVRGEEVLLTRALENVARNALRYAPADSVIQVELKQAGENYLAIVRDQGPGVPEAELEAIFQPFYRVDSTRERESSSSGGTGLGLSIAQRAVNLHGGSITARNRAGGGLEVTIMLPAASV